MKGFVKYMVSTTLQKGDLETFVARYNGKGQVDYYTKILQANMEAYKNKK